MKIRIAPLCALVLFQALLPPSAAVQPMRLPVFFLRYDGGTGWEEISPEELEQEQVESDSQRHKLTLRIKEQWSHAFLSDLYAAVSRKDYGADPGSYTYFYLNPDFQWDLGDRLQWSAAVRSKWTFYDELDEDDLPKDLTSLLARTELQLELADELKLTPYLQAVFDLYRNEAKAQHTYTAGLRLESRLGAAWRLSGRYRGIARWPLGAANDSPDRFNQEFGVNLSWDPNR